MSRSGGKGKQPGTGDDSDELVLQATPISKKRMDLLWLGPSDLDRMEEALRQRESVTVTLGDASELRDHDYTIEDVTWARKIAPFVGRGFAAGERKEHEKAIKEFKSALKLAPGCDLFLMNIGVSCAYLGKKDLALRYLERAVKISPGNKRIRDNLEAVHRH